MKSTNPILTATSWLGAVVLFLAVAAGTTSVLRLHSSLSTARIVAVAPQTVQAGDNQGATRSPIAVATPGPAAPKKTAPPVKAAPVKAAAPVRAAAPVARSTALALRVLTTQQALINQDRARYGLRPLTWSSCLSSVAVSNAARMAAARAMWHANGVYADLACHLGYQTGENIGYWTGGINDSQINSMFMNSPEHKANILGPYRYVATAWRVASNGTAYIAVEFG
jgi:uncharacterized protein YkwD